ncbi:MAG: cobalt ECF transporter T component CbiQ [Deltaproteobacteria bacterium]|nr:cobalt ECF transporter T component CbiQ [Deltaproteobacteria bacterium]
MAQVTLPDWFKEARVEPCLTGSKVKPPNFIEKNLNNIASFMREVVSLEEYAAKSGVLQSLDTRARITGMLAIVAACSITSRFAMLAGVFVILFLMMLISGVSFMALARRVLPSFVFTLALAFPVFFNFMTPGTDALKFFDTPVKVSITYEGLSTGLFFMMRVTSMVSLVALLLLTTRQADFFKGLRTLPVPPLFVTALFMTFRYIFILLKIAEDSTLARKSRTIARTKLSESQNWFASRITLILKKSMNMAEEVNMAMASRGFAGRIKTFDNGRMRGRDYLWLGFSSFVLFLSFGL